jgi:hypothetical protein
VHELVPLRHTGFCASLDSPAAARPPSATWKGSGTT